jgi:hypothetical protein
MNGNNSSGYNMPPGSTAGMTSVEGGKLSKADLSETRHTKAAHRKAAKLAAPKGKRAKRGRG